MVLCMQKEGEKDKKLEANYSWFIYMSRGGLREVTSVLKNINGKWTVEKLGGKTGERYKYSEKVIMLYCWVFVETLRRRENI